MLLAIDTSAGCEVAVVAGDGRILAERRHPGTRGHAEAIGEAIAGALADAGARPAEIAEVVAGLGPGPFTGLRVGVAAARAFALARDIPCTGVPSHDAIAHAWRAEHARDERELIVATDARRRQLAWSRYAPGEIAASDGPRLADPDDVPGCPAAARLDTDAVPAAHLALALLARRERGEPDPSQELRYLREPDAVPLAERSGARA